MITQIIEFLKQTFSQEMVVLIVSALPISELRGGIPLALSFGFSYAKAFWLSILGNSAIIIPALFLLDSISKFLMRWKIFNRFFTWFFARTRKHSDSVEKYGAIGLAIFVAIPLPMTGAWSGCVAAYLFGIKFRYALPSVFLGVVVAGIIVLLTCVGFIGIFSKFVGV
ncbi:MAG: small multi-drug export protein [Elusimicrobia bacterium]|nr:small multi-drug export protein [Elusimicrobiota bacterium]